MLKAFKLNTINMSSQIFTHQNQNNGMQLTFSKMAANYNKKFKYNYKKSTNYFNFNKKERNHTIDLDYKHTDQDRNIKNNHDSRNINTKNTKQKIEKRRSNSSQTYMNNFIFNPHLHSKKTRHHYPKQKDQENQLQKNKTERTMYRQTVDGQAFSPESQNIKIETQNQSIQAIRQGEKRKPSFSTNTINEKQFTGRTHIIIDKMRSRATPKTKYTNTIIQSYKIKSIELVSPLGNRISNKKTGTTTHPYYLDLNDNNQKEIQFDEIQLQKIKYDNRRVFSNHHCRQRPGTSKPAKVEDFEPKPWQSDEKQGMYLKDSISYI